MVSGAQIRAGRNLLKWSTQELAQRAGVGWSTVKRFEDSDGIPRSRSDTLLKLQQSLEAAGVEFIGDPIKSPGVQLRIRK